MLKILLQKKKAKSFLVIWTRQSYILENLAKFFVDNLPNFIKQLLFVAKYVIPTVLNLAH